MTLIGRAPAGALRGHVWSYYGYEEETPGPLRRCEGPGTDVVLVISFEHEWLIGDATEPSRPLERFTSFTGGLRDTCVVTEHAGRSAGMQVNLEPTSARMLLRIPMSELAGQVVPLDAVFGRDGERLVERLAAAPRWNDRFALLDRALQAGLEGAPRASPEVAWAWRRLRETDGGVRVASLADELGWSRRRLVARFRDDVGLAPKTAARIFRFERAKELLALPGAEWAHVAAAAGYYDQSHLINEFRAIAGTTPARYAAQLAAA